MGGEERDDHGEGGVLEAAVAGEVQGAGLGEHLPLVRGCQGDCLKPDSREYCCQGKVQLCKIGDTIRFFYFDCALCLLASSNTQSFLARTTVGYLALCLTSSVRLSVGQYVPILPNSQANLEIM